MLYYNVVLYVLIVFSLNPISQCCNVLIIKYYMRVGGWGEIFFCLVIYEYFIIFSNRLLICV
jgi:hypothetical protein